MKLIYSQFIVLFFLAVTLNAKTIEMTIARDTVLSSDIVVAENVTCTIKPGVTVTFATYGKISVSGILIATGSVNKPIVFTAINRPHGSMDKPGWNGLELLGKSAYAYIRHCRFEGAYRNLIWESSPAFDSCEFVGNHYALYCAKHAKPSVKNSRFYRNVYGVVADLAAPMLLDNSITDNTVGIYLQLSSESIIGRNIIFGNQTNIKSEQVFGENKGSQSLHYLWNLMSQLY